MILGVNLIVAMNIDPTFLEMSFDTAGVRNSQQRLKSLIAELAVDPLKSHQEYLVNRYDLVTEVLKRRIARVIAHWCENKHDPVGPTTDAMMSDITNTSKNNMSLGDFYRNEVKSAIHVLAPTLGLAIPDDFSVELDELEFELLALEERMTLSGGSSKEPLKPEPKMTSKGGSNIDDAFTAEWVAADDSEPVEYKQGDSPSKELTIVNPKHTEVVESNGQNRDIHIEVVNIPAQQAWQMIYSFIGYNSEYIQGTMIPRWKQYPDAFDSDRRFLYNTFLDTIRNATGMQHVAGNFWFADRQTTIDQMWSAYFADLSKHIGPMLTAARLDNSVNDPWWKKLRQYMQAEMRNVSIVWILALGIALVFDGLTTYISLNQTPMEGLIVPVFTVLITALFQIADQLVISYRKREFEAEAISAKFRAQFQRLTKSLSALEETSESFVQLSMNKSKAHADWRAAEDNRKMARRGRFWSARIADINVIVTAYGFAFLFLNSTEPMQALVTQIEFVQMGLWEAIDPWVFLMVGLSVTVSFVVNTAQRTEILGWSMRRLKKDS